MWLHLLVALSIMGLIGLRDRVVETGFSDRFE